MNKKLLSVLQAKCKDFGLSDKAIEDLATSASEGLTDESSDEDIEKVADSLVPYAKLMQAEVTRKAQKTKPKPKQSKGNEGDGDGEEGGEEVPEWFKTQMKGYNEKLQKLEEENENLKTERTKNQRQAEIAEKAKKLGIPSYLMKRVSFADDADIDKELKEYKQELVTNNLMSADDADILSSSEQAAKDDAKAWAKSLPDN